jgi:hypothetical protein
MAKFVIAKLTKLSVFAFTDGIDLISVPAKTIPSRFLDYFIIKSGSLLSMLTVFSMGWQIRVQMHESAIFF